VHFEICRRQYRTGRSCAGRHRPRNGGLLAVQESSRNRRVADAVRTALALINQGLDEVLSEMESEFDPDTRWALAWFEQHQFDEGMYGEAEVLATAKALSISHLAEAGILHSRAGKVRLLRREDLSEDWDPSGVARLTVWKSPST